VVDPLPAFVHRQLEGRPDFLAQETIARQAATRDDEFLALVALARASLRVAAASGAG
jgi:hypothetical protein